MLILSTKSHPDLSALIVFHDFRLPPPSHHVEISDKRSEFRGPSKYEISLRYDHSFVSKKYLIFSIFLGLTLHINSPKESRSVPIMSMPYLGLVLIFPTKFHPNPSTLSVFQDFRFRHHPQLLLHQIRPGFKIKALRYPSKHQISLRSDQSFVS